MKFFTLYSTKYKKMGFKSSVLKDATFHSTFISHTQIGRKLENNLNKLLKKRTVHVLHQTTVPTSDHWRRLQHTFQCFQTMTHHAARKMKGHVTFQMLSIKKETAFSFCTKYLISCKDVGYYNNIKQLGKYSSDFVQNFAENKEEYCCVVQMYGLEHTQCFWWFRSDAVVFWLFKVFSSSLQHTWHIQGKHSWSIDWKYNCRECWCYIIHIKRCFPCTNQWLFLHVLAICL